MEIYPQISKEIKCGKADCWHHLSAIHPWHHSGSSCATTQNLKKFPRFVFAWVGVSGKLLFGSWDEYLCSSLQFRIPLLCECCLQHKCIAWNCVVLTQISSKHHWSLFLSIMMVMELSTVMEGYCIFIHVCLKRNLLLLLCFLYRMKWNLTELSFKMAWGKHKILKNLSRFKASFTSYSEWVLPRGRAALRDGCGIFPVIPNTCLQAKTPPWAVWISENSFGKRSRKLNEVGNSVLDFIFSFLCSKSAAKQLI